MDIDLVYLWVDGSDPAWRAKKNRYLAEAGLAPKGEVVLEASAPPTNQLTNDQQEQAVGDCRFNDNDELRFSLRSVEKFAPWIRRIYIVTDNQSPAWLDTTNDRVRIIQQEDLLDHAKNLLPTYNSNTIELNLWRIPDLSRCFLYANDDMFFAGAVEPSFFFNEQGHPYVRLKVQSLRRHLDRIYPYTIYSAQQEVFKRFGKNYTLAPHHCVDAYNIDSFKACVEEFRERVEITTSHRFREKEDLQRAILLYYAMAKGEAQQVHVSHFNHAKSPVDWLKAVAGVRYFADSRCMPLDTPVDKMRRTLKKYNPKLVCINDGESVTDQVRRDVKKFMEELFPTPSQFEFK